jgi:hypothetical protein
MQSKKLIPSAPKKQEKKKIPVALKRKLELPTRNATMSRGQKPIKSVLGWRSKSFIRRAIQIKRREKFKI